MVIFLWFIRLSFFRLYQTIGRYVEFIFIDVSKYFLSSSLADRLLKIETETVLYSLDEYYIVPLEKVDSVIKQRMENVQKIYSWTDDFLVCYVKNAS